MGFFDDLKKGFKDVSEAAKNSVEEAKAREAQRANAGTLKVDAAPQPQAQAKAPENGNVRKGSTGARLMKEGDSYKLTFGTPSPVPYEDQRYPFSIGIRFNGFVVFNADSGIDPNTIDIDNTAINAVDAGQRALAKLSEKSYPYDKLPAGQQEIRSEIKERLHQLGITCSGVQIASITHDQKSQEKINEWNSKPDHLKAAELAAAGKAAPVQSAPAAGPTVTCGKCGTVCNAGQKFCSECGAVLPK